MHNSHRILREPGAQKNERQFKIKNNNNKVFVISLLILISLLKCVLSTWI